MPPTENKTPRTEERPAASAGERRAGWPRYALPFAAVAAAALLVFAVIAVVIFVRVWRRERR